MTPEQIVDVVTREEVDTTLNKHLSDLHLSIDDLEQQAKSGTFASRDARMLWMAVRHFGKTA